MESQSQTDWNKCFLCQVDNGEALICPANNNNESICGYSTIVKNLLEFDRIGTIPLDVR